MLFFNALEIFQDYCPDRSAIVVSVCSTVPYRNSGCRVLGRGFALGEIGHPLGRPRRLGGRLRVAHLIA